MSRVVLLLCALGVPSAALAGADPAAAQTGRDGGSAAPGPPEVTAARCVDGKPWRCAAGKPLTLRGERLDLARSVVFMGGPGRGDDRAARPRVAGTHRLSVIVPQDASSGPLRVRARLGSSRSSRTLLLTPVGSQQEGFAGAKLFAGGRTPRTFRYALTGAPPAGGAIEVVRPSDGAVVLREPILSGGKVTWNGLVGDQPVPVDGYQFRVSADARGSVTPEPGQESEFVVYDHLFPIRGRHDLGQTTTNNFGGGRNHKGQDMFAACGTPLAAVAPGTVTYAGYQASAAGYYVVLQRDDGESYVYMHMRDRPLVSTGDHLYTGQRVGVVGETGRASGCHLHFELWTAPGWYSGGRAVDPLPNLRRWEKWG